jgi:metal-dependent hydrolase (beta-lactamase superfamily II)
MGAGVIQELSITALVENTAGKFDLLGECGLSLWIEADEHRILYDTGLSNQNWCSSGSCRSLKNW